MNVRRPRLVAAAIGVVALSLAAACSTDDEAARSKAEQLVAATSDAGVAPRLTVEVAEALYGDDAAALCDVFEDGLTSTEQLILLGNPSGRRHKTITDSSIEYAELVVRTYCPDVIDEFHDVVTELDPFESTG